MEDVYETLSRRLTSCSQQGFVSFDNRDTCCDQRADRTQRISMRKLSVR